MGNDQSSMKIRHKKPNKRRKTSFAARSQSDASDDHQECRQAKTEILNNGRRISTSSGPPTFFHRNNTYINQAITSRTPSLSSTDDQHTLNFGQRKGVAVNGSVSMSDINNNDKSQQYKNDYYRSVRGTNSEPKTRRKSTTATIQRQAPVVNGSVSMSDLHNSERNRQYKNSYYQSMRGTSSDPKSSRRRSSTVPISPQNSAIRSPSSQSSRTYSFASSTNSKQGSLDEDYDKLKATKKGKRIANVKKSANLLWELYEFEELTKLSFNLIPMFPVEEKETEVTNHYLDLNFLKIPDEKIDERQQLYDFEVTFTEAKFTSDKSQRTVNTDRLVRGNTFYGVSRKVELTENNAVIEGNFINSEYGKMDFFTFGLILLPAHKRQSTTDDDESNDSGAPDMQKSTPTRLGTFLMKLRGSYASRDYEFMVTEGPNSEQ